MRTRSLLAIALGALSLLAGCTERAKPAPKVYSTLPSFELTDQTGHAFGSRELAGKVWIANFIFTRCTSICPRFTEQMGALEKTANEQHLDVRFVSFSVDPKDTPEILAAYAKEHHADHADWTFLAGSEEQIQDAVVKGLKIAAQPIGAGEDATSIFHGSHFVLVDADGRVRGYYDSEVPERVDALLPDAAALLAASRGAS